MQIVYHIRPISLYAQAVHSGKKIREARRLNRRRLAQAIKIQDEWRKRICVTNRLGTNKINNAKD